MDTSVASVASVTDDLTPRIAPIRLLTPVISLKRLLVSTISADVDCRRLLGIRANVSDPRVYAYYSPTATVDEEKPAYITYAQTGFPERYHATGDPVFNLAIWGMNWEVVEAVRERLVGLFDAKTLIANGGRQVHGVVMLQHDNFQENTKFASVVVQVKLGFSQV
jgi:hypothetical protein